MFKILIRVGGGGAGEGISEDALELMWRTQARIDAKKHKSMRYKRGTGSCVLFILDFSGSMRGSGIISLKQGVFDILDAHVQKVGDFLLTARVVLFTDGRLTDFSNEDAKENEAEQHLSQSRGADIAYRMTDQTTVDREVLRTVVTSVMSWPTYEEEDLDTIHELLSQRTNIIATQERVTVDPADEYHQEKFAAIPKLGTRVRRGPHWTFANQDSEGAGTIVGHGDLAGTVHVEWDTGLRFPYSIGCGGLYNVVVCDEPRIPDDGFAAVGCLVKRGPHWKWDDQDGGVGSIGTIYRVKDDATVYVRWPSGRNSNYRFGYEGKFDIEKKVSLEANFLMVMRQQITDDINCRWQWLNCNGVWVEYPDYVNSQINHSLHKRPKASVVIHYQEQRIVASKSIQINIESKERTEIRCKNSNDKVSDWKKSNL
uniref:E3 ubiquitin-protein ligase MIB2 n=1 Tax=Magallana gigas TaxID=29159 RepID=K1Q5M5_MAGGI